MTSDAHDDLLAWAQAQRLERVVMVKPTNDGSSYLDRMYSEVGRQVPVALRDWEGEPLNTQLDAYKATAAHSPDMYEIFMGNAVMIFDRGLTDERVVITYALSSKPQAERDKSRISRFPDPNESIERRLGDAGFEADRGHFVAHSAGGGININLFPQRRTLNRGHADAEKPTGQGKLFRSMERYAAERPGTFLYHRAIYDDQTWIPQALQYGVLVDDAEWWVELFENK